MNVPDRSSTELNNGATDGGSAVLRADGVSKFFLPRTGFLGRNRKLLHAVRDVSVDLSAGETLGIVGESGCGKSTLGQVLAGILSPSSGRVLYKGRDLGDIRESDRTEFSRLTQYVFQDARSALNPRMTARKIVREPLRIHGAPGSSEDSTVAQLMEDVGLGPEHLERYPHELSGGQRQRLGIARALALEPEVLVLDEPVSALDVSVQAQIVDLLRRLQATRKLSLVFISHDLSVVRQVATTIGVMYLGQIVELGSCDEVLSTPRHPYTRALLSAVPVDHPSDRRQRSRIVLEGDLPNPLQPPPGCKFHTRCWKAQAVCKQEEPELKRRGTWTALVSCHFPEDVIETSAPRSNSHVRKS